MPAADTVEFSANVPKSEYDTFKQNFPQYGAVTWFINQALINFNEEVRRSPAAKEQIEKSIQQMVDLNRLASTSG